MPVTVTVWGTFQLSLVKVREALSGTPSRLLDVETGRVTSFFGFLERATVKVAVPPASVVVDETTTTVNVFGTFLPPPPPPHAGAARAIARIARSCLEPLLPI